jgi:ATP-binding cassette subfamily C protein
VFVRVAPRLSSLQQSWARVLHTVPAYGVLEDWRARCEAAREEAPGDGPAPELTEAIRVDDVWFRYGETSAPTLQGVDLVLPVGSMTAVTGASGAGKSTLVDVVVGLLRPDRGRVLVDGTALVDGVARRWRQRVGYVGQDPFLLHDTVRANLLWANPDATAADLAEALRLAAADFVEDLPEGLDTVVGERGGRLSGGERQRLALARALVRKPALLVLDEATSNLDPDNERRILDAIDGLRGRTTILVVAHRQSTAERADVVCRLEAGRLVPAQPSPRQIIERQ